MAQMKSNPSAGVRRFDDEIRFFKGWMADIKAVGAVLPTSKTTSKRMASICNPDSGLPVLELGPGTGVITREILARGIAPENLYSVEYTSDFVDIMRRDFPDVNVIHGSCFDLDDALAATGVSQFDSAVCAVPVIRHKLDLRVSMVEKVLDLLPPGRPMVAITYFPVPPVPPGHGNYEVTHYDYVIRNVPPANLFLYHRPI